MFDDCKARVRLNFTVEGKKFKKGRWIKGSFMIVGEALYFEHKDLSLVPDYFDLFEIDPFTLQQTFDADLGYANDREEYWEELEEDAE
jgi:hypothetical protein